MVVPVLPPDQPHLIEHGSIKDEYENHHLHSDVRFQNNNGTIFGYLKEETHGTTFASYIKNYKRTCNGYAAWLAINMQHAGESKWREQSKTASAYVLGTKWYGGTNITPEQNIRNCRKAYINLGVMPITFNTN